MSKTDRDGESQSEVGSESLKTRCQRLQDEWIAAEMKRLSTSYDGVADVDTVSGALYYAEVKVGDVAINTMVDPGSSATIMSFELFKKVGKAAGIPKSALQILKVILCGYSQRPIPISAEVEIVIDWKGKQVTAPVYIRSDIGLQWSHFYWELML